MIIVTDDRSIYWSIGNRRWIEIRVFIFCFIFVLLVDIAISWVLHIQPGFIATFERYRARTFNKLNMESEELGGPQFCK